MDRIGIRKLDLLLDTARAGRRTLIMGVLNITPDSFSDGGKFLKHDAACAMADQMVADGADIIDVGGESTRPATFRTGVSISAADELERILPVIAALTARHPETPLSVDTYKADVAAAALAAGAAMINDISAMRADSTMASVISGAGAAVCLMHMAGLPTMIDLEPIYDDVVDDVCRHLGERVAFARAAGVRDERIVLDPGIGFGKTARQSLELLRRQRELIVPGYPLLIGTSRKSTIGAVLGNAPPNDRLEGTAATVAIAIAFGASIVRVHDVKEMARVARMADAVIRGW